MGRWSDMYGLWEGSRVPVVEIVPCPLENALSLEPWAERASRRVVLGLSNPQRATAYHLAVLLRDRSPETVAAYKLFAVAWERGLLGEYRRELDRALESGGLDGRGWWHHIAKYVLPPLRRGPYLEPYDGWKSFVAAAAQEWSAIANEYVIIEIADYLERGSPRREALEAQGERIFEERDRAEYERLRRKFDGA